jgi:hypothetical protein
VSTIATAWTQSGERASLGRTKRETLSTNEYNATRSCNINRVRLKIDLDRCKNNAHSGRAWICMLLAMHSIIHTRGTNTWALI